MKRKTADRLVKIFEWGSMIGVFGGAMLGIGHGCYQLDKMVQVREPTYQTKIKTPEEEVYYEEFETSRTHEAGTMTALEGEGDVERVYLWDLKDVMKADEAGEAELEKIVMRSKPDCFFIVCSRNNLTFHSKPHYDDTVQDQHTKSIFETGNRQYNDFRKQIRQQQGRK